jgi:hypothetical protein
MLLALPFARKSGATTLPAALSWLNTPDDPSPAQGMYEPQVAWVSEHLGWYVKTWYWLGLRNQLNGLFSALAPISAVGDATTASGPYPSTKSPFRAGTGFYTIRHNGNRYFEFKAVGQWSTVKCWQFGIGWKVNAILGLPGQPIMFLFQIKPLVTIG